MAGMGPIPSRTEVVMRRLCSLLLLAVLAACRPGPISASPAPVATVLAVSADTIKVTATACVAVAEPGVACEATVTGTVGTTALNFGAPIKLLPGQDLVVATPYTCTTPGLTLPVSVRVSTVALNRSNEASAPSIGTGTGTLKCRDAVPGAPGQVIVTIVTVASP